MRTSPRGLARIGAIAALVLAATACSEDTSDVGSAVGTASTAAASSTATAPPALGGAVDPAQLDALVEQAMDASSLRAVMVRVTVDGEPAYEVARGESMSGVPATTGMHFRYGAFGFTVVATLLMVLVDEGEVSLDDPLSNWYPDLPRAGDITLQNLANMTSGYADYVYQPEVLEGTTFEPFRQWTPEELIDIGVASMDFEPGTNWGYSHTNYVILGQVLEQVTGMELSEALRARVLEPIGATGTTNPTTPAIPDPVLHSFSSERRGLLQIPADVPFYEDATFWNPSWTTHEGAVGVSTISDLTTIMEAVGTGELLSEESFEEQTAPNLIGFGQTDPNCAACRENNVGFNYALGAINVGPWFTQSKNFAGSDAAAGYLAERQLAVAVVANYGEEAFDDEGNYTEASASAAQSVFRQVVDVVAPDTLPSP
ncbi:MAG: serine hydrolase domain-containing protein [Ilumatobacteraceae bacterium]